MQEWTVSQGQVGFCFWSHKEGVLASFEAAIFHVEQVQGRVWLGPRAGRPWVSGQNSHVISSRDLRWEEMGAGIRFTDEPSGILQSFLA